MMCIASCNRLLSLYRPVFRQRVAKKAALAALLFCSLVFISVTTGYANAGVLRYCDKPDSISAAQQDKLLRFASLIKQELDQSGESIAIVSRSGLDLSRFDQRYSHAGISIKESANAPWSVRQLYYDCEADRPKIFDQGMAGFVTGTSDPAIGFISIVFLPEEKSNAVERTVQNNPLALALLGSTYSANAYPFSDVFQNCNQWVIELIATAWSGRDSNRTLAQAWLQQENYQPSQFNVGNRLLMWLGGVIPWLNSKDHPSADLEQAIYRVSMPSSIEAFVKTQAPSSTRIELCHTDKYMVIKRGWESITPGCKPGENDTVIAFD